MTITSYGSTYPFVQTNAEWEMKMGQRQQPVTPTPLSFRRIRHVRTKVVRAVSDTFCSAVASQCASFVANFISVDDADMKTAHNKAYAKFRDQLLVNPSQLGSTLGEYHQAIGMMTERVSQLTKSALLIKRGKFGEALKELGVLDRAYFYRDGKYSHFVDRSRCKTDPITGNLFFEKRKAGKAGRRRFYVKRSTTNLSPRTFYSKDFADTWLEVHFGWVPLVQDIKSGLEVMVSVPPMKKITASASVARSSESLVTGFLWQPVYNSLRAQSVVRLGALVQVSNPNLYRANQLGIVNPLAVAWELTPWSFLVDWFVNIGDCINSMSDLFGVQLVQPYTTRYRVAVSHEQDMWDEKNCDYASFGVDRNLGISGPFLQIRPFKLWGWQRLATAVSLMIQQFR